MNKIILADNQAIFRAGTAKILAMEDDFRIIAQCPDSERLYHALDTFHGAVLMFASTLTRDVSFLLQRVARSGSRSIAILENNEAPEIFLDGGVQGLIYRGANSSALIECVRQVAAGGKFYQPSTNHASKVNEDTVGARVRDRLTSKEMKIVALIVQGCKNKEIAIRLGTTEQVVKNYLRNVYDKTGVSDRLELALFTIHHKMLADAAAAIGNEMMGVMA